MHKEERGVLEEMRELDQCDVEEFDTLGSSEKTIAFLGDRWWPQTAKQEREKSGKNIIYGNNVMSAQMLEVSLLGMGTVLRLKRDAWSTVK